MLDKTYQPTAMEARRYAAAGYTVVLIGHAGHDEVIGTTGEAPDAILLDVMMPEMDGPTTYGRLQEDPRTSHIPVMLLTAKVQGPDQRIFASLGVRAVLFKPFDPLTLSDQIAELLGW